MFTHKFVELPKVVREDTDSGRFYRTPDGNRYPSVTTVIGAMSDKSGLDNWRLAVGEEEAERVTKRSAVRGTEVHRLCEQYVLNNEINFMKEMPLNTIMFNQIKSVLDANVNDIMASEAYLFSDTLKTAGAVDLIAKYQGKNSIIDFKTSSREKEREWITGYFIQKTAYAIMFYERTGIMCPQIVCIISLEQGNAAQVFIDKTVNWMKPTMKMFSDYHKAKEIKNECS